MDRLSPQQLKIRVMKTVLIAGGAGYVGSALVPALLEQGWNVRVLDLYLFGRDILPIHKNLVQIKGDIRNPKAVDVVLHGVDAVIHLACISNDPSFELDPALGKSINYDSFLPFVQAVRRARVRRFIYASSSSVYGVKSEPKVTEDLLLEPLTDYSKYKALCEGILLKEASTDFVPVILRPATVCGYAPRLRLDVVVNSMTNAAITNRKIIVHGGNQKRPNIHIADMIEAYCRVLEAPDSLVANKIFNVGGENMTLNEIAECVRRVIGSDVLIERQASNDPRSYHISSENIRSRLGWMPKKSIASAVSSLQKAFTAGKVPKSLDARYINIKILQARPISLGTMEEIEKL